MKICPTCQKTYPDDFSLCPRDGARLIASATETEVQLAAGLARRYRILRRLGQGGMGAVFLVEQIGVGNRLVALKVLNRKLLDDPEFLMRFQNEAGSTGRIHHPNVVTIYESAQADDGTPYIAMEFLEGESLRDALKRRGALPVPEVAEILQQAARGLNAAHKLGIIHRDLKPDNIFLTYPDDESVPPASPPAQVQGAIAPTGAVENLVVKIVDFGIAKLRESATHTQTGMVLGTPAYMSFEQASGMRSDELDARSDVYSLGVVVYEMLTGRTPFHSDTPVGYLRMHMQEDPPPLRAVKPDLPALPQLESVVMKALTKDRNQRYGSVLEFARELTSAAQPLPPVETQVPPLSTLIVSPPALAKPSKLRMARWSHSTMKFVAIAGVALIFIVAGVWYFSQPAGKNPNSDGLIKKGDASWSAKAGESKGEVRINPNDGLKYMWIPPGTFMMGCSPGDTECRGEEKPRHRVTITRGFWLGQTEVTVGAYKRFAGGTGRAMPETLSFNPGWSNEQMPIVNVSWDNAQMYCVWAGGRLPTEAEWEYAARGGSTEALYGPLDEVAWYSANSGNQTHPVGQKRANGFGLYEMLGNAEEWVKDWYDGGYYQSSPSKDPAGPTTGQERVLRGGSWFSVPGDVRVSYRGWDNPAAGYISVGLRCVGDVAGQKVVASQMPTAASHQPPKGFVILYGDSPLDKQNMTLFTATDRSRRQVGAFIDTNYPTMFQLTGILARNDNDGAVPLRAEAAYLSFDAPIQLWQANASRWQPSPDRNVEGWSTFKSEFNTNSIDPGYSIPFFDFLGTPIPATKMRVQLMLKYGRQERKAEFTITPPSTKKQTP
jgi:serine/threonine-protein kinase